MLRFGYRQRFKVFKNSNVAVSQEWVLLNKDSPFLPYEHPFGSRVWDNDRYEQRKLGEVPWPPQKMPLLPKPKPFPNKHICGTKSEWQRGLDIHEHNALVAELGVIPNCCPEADGGLAFQGHADVEMPGTHYGTGGLASTASAEWGPPWCCWRPIHGNLYAQIITQSGDTCIDGKIIELSYHIEEGLYVHFAELGTACEEAVQIKVWCMRRTPTTQYKWYTEVSCNFGTLVDERWDSEWTCDPLVIRWELTPQHGPIQVPCWGDGTFTLVVTDRRYRYVVGRGGFNGTASADVEFVITPPPDCVETLSCPCVPTELSLKIVAVSGCECLDDMTLTLTYVEELNAWRGDTTSCSSQTFFTLSDLGYNIWLLAFNGYLNGSFSAISSSCDPLSLAYTVTLSSSEGSCDLWLNAFADGGEQEPPPPPSNEPHTTLSAHLHAWDCMCLGIDEYVTLTETYTGSGVWYGDLTACGGTIQLYFTRSSPGTYGLSVVGSLLGSITPASASGTSTFSWGTFTCYVTPQEAGYYCNYFDVTVTNA